MLSRKKDKTSKTGLAGKYISKLQNDLQIVQN